MEVFTLLLNRVHVFAIFMSNLNREAIGNERVKIKDICLGPLTAAFAH